MWSKNCWCLGIGLVLFCSFVSACDWRVEILSADFFNSSSEFEFRYFISKIYGNKTNVTLIRQIVNETGIVVNYENYTKEITTQHTTPYLTPNIEPGNYTITGRIFPNCSDANLTNNYIEKFVIINGSFPEPQIDIECDWKIEILLDDYVFEKSTDINWTVKVSKNYGDKANVSVRGYVRDMLSDWQMNYAPWTMEAITNYRTRKYTPNLWEDKFYLIFYNITELSCNDTYSTNNFDNKFIIVLPKQLSTNYSYIKINELLPNPTGADDSAMPNGEFVELYNKGNEDLNLENLGLKDDYGQDIDIFISNSNTLNGTVINANSYLVVYMNGRFGFLNNNGFEKISLYKDDFLIDEVSYSGSEENSSWSKVDNKWIEMVSTPGRENIEIEEEEEEEEEETEEIEEVEEVVSVEPVIAEKKIVPESNINKITGEIIYEDKGEKQKRSALYFFCALMVFIVIYYAYGREQING